MTNYVDSNIHTNMELDIQILLNLIKKYRIDLSKLPKERFLENSCKFSKDKCPRIICRFYHTNYQKKIGNLLKILLQQV